MGSGSGSGPGLGRGQGQGQGLAQARSQAQGQAWALRPNASLTLLLHASLMRFSSSVPVTLVLHARGRRR